MFTTMGCCISANRSSVAQRRVRSRSKVLKSKRARKRGGGCSKSPPPTLPLCDEETVKEVLSETHSAPRQRSETPFIKSAPLLADFSKLPDGIHPDGAVPRKPFVSLSDDDVPEVVRELCSTLEEAVVVSAKGSEKRENKPADGNGGVRGAGLKSPAKFKNRSSSVDVKTDKPPGKSPGRTPTSSRDRSRPGPVSSSGYGRRRDPGETSARRSRSPVSRTDGGSSKTDLGRSSSSRRTGKSPGRVGSSLGDRLRKLDNGKENGRDKWPQSTDSLENPVVSLECFIFLEADIAYRTGKTFM